MISWSFSSRIVVLRYDWYSPIPMEPKMILLSWFGMQPPWLSWWSSEVMGVTIFSWFLRLFAIVWRCESLAYLWQSIAINECGLPVRNYFLYFCCWMLGGIDWFSTWELTFNRQERTRCCGVIDLAFLTFGFRMRYIFWIAKTSIFKSTGTDVIRIREWIFYGTHGWKIPLSHWFSTEKFIAIARSKVVYKHKQQTRNAHRKRCHYCSISKTIISLLDFVA